ncbi:MAG: hypothetical protein JO309_09780 [Pseudonocardiales bacterium]|nr:hypothetical protein [Pseudonocardiales bacterium]MBV9729676.1 hypothetical protein [Pseudonocardiales bacterium]
MATRSLPAYHLLTRSDLDPPDPGLTGRYTLRAVSESHPVDTTALGPKLAPGSLTGRVITTLRGQPQAARLFGQDQHLPPRPPESVTAAGGPGEERADASVVLESGYDAAWATPQPGGPEGALW